MADEHIFPEQRKPLLAQILETIADDEVLIGGYISMAQEDEVASERNPSNAVITYRLGLLEREVSQIDRKLDSFISLYPSKEILDYMIDPLKISIKELKDDIEDSNRSRDQEKTQRQMILYAAMLSPVAAIIISLLFAALGAPNP